MAQTPVVPLNRRRIPAPAELLSRHLLAQWEIVRAKFPADGRKADAETIHDLRVASRRLRAALGLIRELVPARKLRRPRKEMRRLGRALGGVREVDVNIEQLLNHRAPWAGVGAAGLEALLALEFERQRRLREQMGKRLRSFNLGRLERDLRLVASERDAPDAAPVSLADFARLKVDERLAGLRRVLGRAAAHPTPRNFHLLRIEVKKFRYVVELLSSAFESRRAARIRRRLKSLQDALGTFHDLDVLHRSLGASRRKFREDGLRVLERETLRIQRRLAGELKGAGTHLNRRLEALSRTGFWDQIAPAIKANPTTSLGF